MTSNVTYIYIFFFSSRRRHTRFDCDWSSDVCSSDLEEPLERLLRQHQKQCPLARRGRRWRRLAIDQVLVAECLPRARQAHANAAAAEIGRASCRERV